ncbi:hypothetical protein L6164_000592 [Bauhinia variegata]|uniref:Uncharacterized protein n=1 Tax=Bauhinia variegata TaxID=167791 RepID=A0ACB9Q6E6_BAUVA|nr:hypothetical protein L6164_000592 [Bauhinia variegata]
MAILDSSFDDFNPDIINEFEELNWEEEEDLEKGSSESKSFLEQPLCVPQDPIDDLEWYPNFIDDLISFNCFEFFDTRKDTVSHQNKGYEEDGELQRRQQTTNGVVVRYEDGASSFGKKPRKKRVRGSAWLKSAADFKKLENVHGKKRCSHCESEETPLRRNGPLGQRALCNACRVRYKSGRLMTEHRPAASPTFDGRKHSNFHRRIIKKKRLSD